MTEKAFAACLAALVNDERGEKEMFDDAVVRDARPYDELGVMTSNAGMVVRMDDGSEFQVTVVRSRGAR